MQQIEEIQQNTTLKIEKKSVKRGWNGIENRKTYKFLDKDIENIFILFFDKKNLEKKSLYIIMYRKMQFAIS